MSAIDNRFFKNTYVTGEGRQNYKRIDRLEDPLFTSFTFDIDYLSSPLFYTISGDVYDYPNTIGMCEKIEDKLEYMNLKNQDGYDILPLFSASFDGGEKMGFGLQKNVYTDLPLYGATEYIYMVDKRNGGINQNDVRYDNNNSHAVDFDVNGSNSYKLGDSIKELVSESDRKWADKQKEQNDERVGECFDILNDANVQNDHSQNESAYNDAKNDFENCTVDVDGEELNEEQLLDKIKECEDIQNNFDNLKKDIVDHINDIFKRIQKKGNDIYNKNKCIQYIYKLDRNKDIPWDSWPSRVSRFYEHCNFLVEKYGNNYQDNLKSYVEEFTKLYDELKIYSNDNFENINLDDVNDEFEVNIMYILNNFADRLENFGLIKDDGSVAGKIYAIIGNPPGWCSLFRSHAAFFMPGEDNNDRVNQYSYVDEMIKIVMSSECDVELSFDEYFTSDIIKKSIEDLHKYKNALNELNKELYGRDESGNARDKNNPSSDSKYGKYLEAKNKLENDDYSLAEKEKKLAESGYGLNKLIKEYDDEYKLRRDDPYFSEPNSDIKKFFKKEGETDPIVNSLPPQTVLDILGFISGMKKMTLEYPYIIQGITGLDVAYNKHYGIKDPYLGSGEDKITLTCLESLDLRVSSMFNRYFNAIYDRQYRRERVPVNLRRFNCSIYVHDIRNFVSKLRYDNDNKILYSENRILELKDMYYSVIEFRFYDCEIISEETGNIFNDISNEAPSDMKKTNFTFTYGNCVVNFVPNELVKKYREPNIDTEQAVKRIIPETERKIPPLTVKKFEPEPIKIVEPKPIDNKQKIKKSKDNSETNNKKQKKNSNGNKNSGRNKTFKSTPYNPKPYKPKTYKPAKSKGGGGTGGNVVGDNGVAYTNIGGPFRKKRNQ